MSTKLISKYPKPGLTLIHIQSWTSLIHTEYHNNSCVDQRMTLCYCEVLWWVCLSVRLSVCLSVCLSVREDISGTTRAIFTKYFAHVAYVRGSVLRRHVDDRPHRPSAGRGDGTKCNLRLPCWYWYASSRKRRPKLYSIRYWYNQYFLESKRCRNAFLILALRPQALSWFSQNLLAAWKSVYRYKQVLLISFVIFVIWLLLLDACNGISRRTVLGDTRTSCFCTERCIIVVCVSIKLTFWRTTCCQW